MRKFFLLLSLALFVVAHADEQYLGLYMGGNKIGYSSYTTRSDTLAGKKATRADSKTFMGAGLLGGSMKVTIEGTTWTDVEGRPLKMLFVMTSQGRTQRVTAAFGATTAEIDVENGGQKTHKSLPIPTGAAIVDDPLELMVSGAAAGSKRTVYILDPTTITFMKNEVVLVGAKKTTVKGSETTLTLVQIVDPRMTTDVYLSSKGDIVKVQAPMGIEMYPEPREVALSLDTGGYRPSADLAIATSIHPDKTINDPASLTRLKIRVIGRDLSRLPSDEHQTVSKDGESWIVDVHPPKYTAEKAVTIKAAAKMQPQWVAPSLHMPATSKRFKELSASIVKGEKHVIPAAMAIHDYVQRIMRPNMGIGVLRDATEVLASKEGVCRDYSILTATLMRSAGIPARLVSGVVNFQGDFYYHAWVEIWDGSKWIGIDSTVPERKMSAAHVKLADGNVEQAFAFTFLDKVSVEVLDMRRD